MKYPEGSNLEYDQERMDIGSALRRLGHAVVGHEAEIDELREARVSIDGLSHLLESAPIRVRDVAQFLGSKAVEVPDGSVITSHMCRPGSGPGSPHGLDMVVRRSGERIEARFQLGSSVEGAPQRGHGGIVALALDDAMGFVLNLIHTVAYTGELTIRYKSATPLHRPLVIQSWLGKREGRKLWLEAELREDFVGAPIIATATGLFISIEAY